VDELRQKILDLLGEIPSPDDSEDMGPWRSRIDLLDQLILQLLNERSRCATEIGHIKKDLGMPVYVPSREVQVIRNVRENNPGPLPDEAVEHLFERIIDETRSLERRTYQAEPDASKGRSEGE
jgi:chorismate mutase